MLENLVNILERGKIDILNIQYMTAQLSGRVKLVLCDQTLI